VIRDEIGSEFEDGSVDPKIEILGDRGDPPTPSKIDFMPCKGKEDEIVSTKRDRDRQVFDSLESELRDLLHRRDEGMRLWRLGRKAALLRRLPDWRLRARTWDGYCVEVLGASRAHIATCLRLAREFDEHDLEGLGAVEANLIARAPARDRARLLAAARAGELTGDDLEAEVRRLREAAGCRPGPRARRADADGEAPE
jgi:hypothetical protein